MNQRHHGEHAVAEWRTKNQKKKKGKKKKKEGEGGTSLSILRTNQRGGGFLSHAMQEGGGGARHLRAGEGWANQYTPTCQSQGDGVKKTVEKGGGGGGI